MYEWGVFNADKDKITRANGADPDDPSWSFLWQEPIRTFQDENEAKDFRDLINQERAEDGYLASHGPVKLRRVPVTRGEWEDV